MSLLDERFTDQFHEWETRGRGWQVWPHPVSPEPPFLPFRGHYLERTITVDDGRKPTFLSSLVAKLSGKLADPKPAEEIIEEESEEEEPEEFQRGELVELCASLPSTTQISKDIFEQFLSSLNNCQEPIAFELIGAHDCITVQFVAAEYDVDLIRQQFEGHFPEVVFTKQETFLERTWKAAEAEDAVIFEFGLAHEFMIQIAPTRNFNVDPYIGLIAAMSNLRENELALFQVVFEPVKHDWDESIFRSVTDGAGKDFFVNEPELSGEAKKKIARPLFAVVVRIAIKSNDRMLKIANDLAGAMTVFSNPASNAFIPLHNKDYNFFEHQEDLLLRQSHRSGMILNTDELVSLVHLPSTSVKAPKLRREAHKTKAVPEIARSGNGLLLGFNSYAGITSEVRLSAEQRVRHTYVIGTSGTGKSTMLVNLIQQDIENGQGVAVFDPHGDLVEKILGMIPEHRINDVVLIDPGDETHSVGFNILSAHSELEKNLLASDLVSAFQRLSTSWGDQMGSVLNNAILAFLESSRGGTLADLQRFLIEPSFRNEFLKTVQDSQVLYYWKKAFPQLSGNKSIGPVLTRLGTFLDRKPVRYMVTQQENRINFAEIMDTGKIFLAKLSQGQIGTENAYLLGSFIVSKFQQLAMSRQGQAAASRRDFWLYVDEFHNFITPSMAQILSGTRKYRLGLTLAHQELRQLQKDSDVASAVLSNPYTRICFRVGDDDARKLGDGFSFFDNKDLQKLPNFQALCRVERADCDFNLSIPAPLEVDEVKAEEIRKRVVTASREKYARLRKDIEADELASLLESEEEPPQPKKKDRSEARTSKDTKPEKPAHPTTPTETTPPEVTPASVSEPPLPVEVPIIEPVAVAVPPIEPVPTVTVQHEQPPTPPPDMGRGGAQHKAVQQRIKSEAQQIGCAVSIEERVLDGQGSVDLLIQRGNAVIACEISFTTTIDHEVGNVTKCLKAGFKVIAVVCTDLTRLLKIEKAICGCLSPEQGAMVKYFTPEQLLAYIKQLPVDVTPPPETERKIGKYKVKRSHSTLTEEERKIREGMALTQMTEIMKPKKRKK